MDDGLTGRVALVTGASRGIGRAIAVALATEGVWVVVNYRSRAEEARQVGSQIEASGGQASPIQADVSRSADVQRLIGAIPGDWPPVTILVNNAGMTRPQALHEITEQSWRELRSTPSRPR
jgi:3-oxoacyl-[acyl-carrier protein] reductase